jgi:hypothetical protein
MRKLLAVVLAMAAAGPVRAETGRTAATTLNRTQSAKPGSLGGAHAAATGSLDGAFYNPASVAKLAASEAQATYLRGLASDSLGGLRYGHAFGFGGAYVGADYFDAGSIDLNLSDGSQRNVRAQQDMAGVLGIALGRESALSVGAAVKAFRLELAETASASGTAFDAGALWTTPVRGLSLGVSGTNMGSDVKFEEESDPLPTAGRAGLSYTLALSRFRAFKQSPFSVRLLVDGVAERHEESSVRAGLEISRFLTDILEQAGSVSLRGGYQSEPRTVTAGFGFILGGFGLDYAFGLVDEIDDDIHRATLSWRFLSPAAAVEVGAKPEPRRPTMRK